MMNMGKRLKERTSKELPKKLNLRSSELKQGIIYLRFLQPA